MAVAALRKSYDVILIRNSTFLLEKVCRNHLLVIIRNYIRKIIDDLTGGTEDGSLILRKEKIQVGKINFIFIRRTFVIQQNAIQT